MSGADRVGFFMTGGVPGVFSAACLVTDSRGVPVEFKYVLPLRPREMQKIIYGKQLEEYLKNTLLKQRLEECLETKPLFVICAWDEWTLSGSFADLDCLAIRGLDPGPRGSGLPGPDPLTRVHRNSPTEAHLASTLQRTLQIRFFTEEPERQREILDKLRRLDASMDLLEPLDRLEKALRYICTQDLSNEELG